MTLGMSDGMELLRQESTDEKSVQLAPECATGNYILGLAHKELIGGRTAVLGPTYKKTLLLSIPAGSAEPPCGICALLIKNL